MQTPPQTGIPSYPQYLQLIDRISNLIFPQLRTLLLESDMSSRSQSLSFSDKDILTFAHTTIKTSIQTEFNLPVQKNQFGYEEVLFILIQEMWIRGRSGGGARRGEGEGGFRVNFRLMNYDQFVEKFCGNQLKSVKIKPAVEVLEQVFAYLWNQGERDGQGFNDELYAKFLADIGIAYIQQYYQ